MNRRERIFMFVLFAIVAICSVLLYRSQASDMTAQSTLNWDVAPDALKFRAVDGFWIWTYSSGVATPMIYLPCVINVYDECDYLDPTICWSVEVYTCPGTHGGVPPVRHFDYVGGTPVSIYIGTDGDPGLPPDATVPNVALWPDVCVGTTTADFRQCCLDRGGCV